jgi:hypothetical protein
MPDARRVHYHQKPSLLNQPLYNGAANAMYGDRGPQRASPDYGGRGRKAMSTPPMSLEHYIQDAIAKVPDLSPRQRLALRNTFMSLTRDIGYIRLITESAHAHGPWSQQAVDHSEATLPPFSG